MTTRPALPSRLTVLRAGTLVALLAVSTVGCRQDMHDQPRIEPLEASTFFADGMASRPPIEGTIARGQLRADTALYTGKDESGVLLATLPVAVDRPLLERGQQRYDIFCSPCHGGLGDGQGMVAQRGFKQPPSFHEDPLASQPVGYYFDVMTNGFGVMSSYAAQISVEDRWAIAAYLRALQLSQGARLAELSPADRRGLEESLSPQTTASDDHSGGH